MRFRRVVALMSLVAACKGTEPRVVASFDIEGDSVTIVEKEAHSLKFTALDADGGVIEDPQIFWFSRNYGVASPGGSNNPDTDPYVVGTGEGRTVIVGRVGDGSPGGIEDTLVVRVTRAVVAQVVAFPELSTIIPGETVQMTAIVKEHQGFTLDRPVTWTALDGFATVSPTGLVTGVTPGTAFITATSEGVTALVKVNVSPTSFTYDVYTRGGTTTPGTATLTITGKSIRDPATLSVGGQSLAVTLFTNSEGVSCVLSQTASGPVSSCSYRPTPATILLCRAEADLQAPHTLQYILVPRESPDRQVSTAASLVSAMQSSANPQTIEVFERCTTSSARWTRNTNGTFVRFPNTATSYSAAEITALLDGAVIFSAPGAGSDPSKYLALRIGPGLFEVWH